MKYVQQLFPATAVPALLLGLSTNAFRDLISGPVGTWIGRIALGLFVASALVYVTLLVFHRVIPRRFANLVYLFDEEMNIAVITHPYHKRIQPPGSRLGYHEPPHEAVRRVLMEELGLHFEGITLLPDDHEQIGNVTFVPPPIRVQVERHQQRLGVAEHYDFVYLALIRGIRPELRSALSPRWMSLDELREMSNRHVDLAPFADIVPTVEKLIPIATKHRANPVYTWQ